MLASMTSYQFSEWMAYFQLEGLGDYPDFRADFRAGVIASTLANLERKKGSKAYTAFDFMPISEERREAQDQGQSWEQLHQGLTSLATPKRGPRRKRPDGSIRPEPSGGRTDHEGQRLLEGGSGS